MAADSGAPGVAVTRGEGPEGPLTRLLEADGARVLQWGSIDFAPPEDPGPLLTALGELERYDWIYFSSPRAVDAVVSRVPDQPKGPRTAVVGPSTAKALSEAGWTVHRVAEDASGEGVVESFERAGDAAGSRILFPASAMARAVVPDGLAELGARVHQITAYRLVNLPLDVENCRGALDGGQLQAVTFASPSAMEGLRLGLPADLFRRLAETVPAAAMGSTTAGALEGVGWVRVEVAEEATLKGLAAAAMRAAGSGLTD